MCDLKKTTSTWIALVALLLSGGVANGADVPVIGISTGDANRGPLVDYIQAMASVKIRTPGYTMISPQSTARMADEAADKPRPKEEVVQGVSTNLDRAWEAIQDQDWGTAQSASIAALQGIEKDDGARIPLGAQDFWVEACLMLASSYELAREKKIKKRKKRGEPSEEDRGAAKEALRPIFDYYPDYVPDEETWDEDVLTLYYEVKDELRRTGTLSVTSPGSGAMVYIDGRAVGRTNLEGYRLTAGIYEVQAGKPDQPSRIHSVEVAPGKESKVHIDPHFEWELTTDGYAIVEAPPGQSAETIAVQVGAGIGTLVDTRYALAFSVEGSNPHLLYAAMVDVKSGVVLREKTMEAEPGPVRTEVLHELLLYVIEGKTIDRSWPAVRWGWITSTTLTVALVTTSVLFYLDAEQNLSDGENRDQFTSKVEGFEDAAAQSQNIAVITAGVAFLTAGLTAWFMVMDFGSSDTDVAQRPGWMVFAAPTVDVAGNTGGAVGLSLSF